MPIDRTVFNAAVDDDGTGTSGTIADKAWIEDAILDPIDAALTASGAGDVVGPASSVDDRIATFDGATGKLIQDGGQTIAQVIAASTGTPGGADTQVQYNNAGAFGGDAGLTYNAATDTLTAGALALSLGQIAFPATQNASANANTLDDYEEGTWTPIIGGTGGQSGQTYASQVGRYVKIGQKVHVQGYAQLSAKGTITSQVVIKGLPFTSENTTVQYAVCTVFWQSTVTSYVSMVGLLRPNTTQVEPLALTAAAVDSVSTTLATANVGNSTGFGFTITYVTTA